MLRGCYLPGALTSDQGPVLQLAHCLTLQGWLRRGCWAKAMHSASSTTPCELCPSKATQYTERLWVPPPQVAEQDPHSPVFHLQVTESTKKKVSPAKLPGGTEESVPHPYRNQTGMMSLCRIESEASSHLTKRAQLNWQCRALVPLQRHISSYKTLVSLEMQSSPRRGRSLSMGFGLLMSAKMLCLE